MTASIGFLGAVTAFLLPPRALAPAAQKWTAAYPVARGAYHVHSHRSDGTGTIAQIAEAARNAGLHFVVVTDHGDGTRPIEPPAYRSGVLCLDGVEISTSGGHYVALGLPVAPYRLAGAPVDVVEDVRRLGGFGVAAHPDSPKNELRWTTWEAAIDGLEWLNADSEWRDEIWASLGRSLLTYFFRPAETLAALLDRPADLLHQWDRQAAERRVVGLAAADAHARLGYRQAVDPYEDRVLARLPGYESAFRVFENRLELDRPLTGDAREDAATVLDALREGHVHTVVTGLAAAGVFEFAATSGRRRARAGEYLDLDGGVVINARVEAPPDTTVVLLKDGRPMYDTREGRMHIDVGAEPGVYRLEAHLGDASDRSGLPWLVSNPIYVGLRDAHRAIEIRRRQPLPTAERVPVETSRWRAEVSTGSASRVEPASDGGLALTWHYELGSTRGAPHAAVSFPISGIGGFDRVVLKVHANRPMRLWVQLRESARGERWGSSFYADATPRDVVLAFTALRPLDAPSRASPPLDAFDSLLIVADTTNGRRGESGTVHLRELWIAR